MSYILYVLCRITSRYVGYLIYFPYACVVQLFFVLWLFYFFPHTGSYWYTFKCEIYKDTMLIGI